MLSTGLLIAEVNCQLKRLPSVVINSSNRTTNNNTSNSNSNSNSNGDVDSTDGLLAMTRYLLGVRYCKEYVCMDASMDVCIYVCMLVFM